MGKQKVLIIEDDVDLLEIEKMQLENAGYEVHTAQDASNANELLLKETYDCILLDMNLNESSGKDVILTTKKHDHKNYHTPIVIVSGDLNIELVREIREKISTILVKPFNANDLNDKIKNVIKNAQLSKGPKKAANGVMGETTKAKSIFVVDDDNDYITELRDFFEEERFQVISSTNSQEAAVKLQNQRFDVLLVDLDIDHRNGEWIINLLRRDSGHINFKTPVIVVSGFTDTGSPRLKDMVQVILEKPVSFIELIKIIRQEIAKSDTQTKIVKTI